MTAQATIFSPSKVDLHARRVESYWNGESIFPVTLELDLTQRCTRDCPECPYSAARSPGLTLQLPFLDRLFSVLGPHTPGLIISGGEPTSVKHYPQTLALARARGFREVSTISNGTCLQKKAVQDALLEHGTAVRVSLYDWQDGETASFRRTIRNIEGLRRRIDDEGSRLQIGAALLTRKEWVPRSAFAAMAALEAGAHWVYFHPFCVEWDADRPRMADQAGVIDFVDRLGREAPPDANLQLPSARYMDYPLRFSKLHAAHFLMQVGADGVAYSGPECKYDNEYALMDLKDGFDESFVKNPRRLQRIDSINSDNYRYIGTRHRPPMFSDYLERTRPGANAASHCASGPGFLHPSLL
jgi:hypothetical protein